MTMTDWFLAELESETAKSRRVLEQVPREARLEAAREIDGVRLPVGSGREHFLVGRHGHHAGRAGYRAEGRTEIQASPTEYQRGARGRARQGRRPGARGPAEDQRCGPQDPLAPPREEGSSRWSSRATR